ncbi:hypothetical protein [uncultured Alsobacter sp.]|uniref:hypothetical protein n=1 Tax=uncultured Alsobacter sp. TaxID=1748258 RepID=UPI0025D4C4F5|nr:hypothetical protein [uncultured Alsobacter sp.]
MRAIVVCLAATLALAGCDTYRRMKETTFTPLGGGVYTYTAKLGADSEQDIVDSEPFRISNLEFYLRENRLCPAGYVVEQRELLKTGESLRGAFYDAHYRIRCR